MLFVIHLQIPFINIHELESMGKNENNIYGFISTAILQLVVAALWNVNVAEIVIRSVLILSLVFVYVDDSGIPT
jgi:hypothetical protein